MKYLKTYEAKWETLKWSRDDLDYLSKTQGAGIIRYIEEVMEYYKMDNEQLHNLRLAVEYNYLFYKDFRDVVSEIINNNRVWSSLHSEKKFI